MEIFQCFCACFPIFWVLSNSTAFPRQPLWAGKTFAYSCKHLQNYCVFPINLLPISILSQKHWNIVVFFSYLILFPLQKFCEHLSKHKFLGGTQTFCKECKSTEINVPPISAAWHENHTANNNFHHCNFKYRQSTNLLEVKNQKQFCLHL